MKSHYVVLATAFLSGAASAQFPNPPSFGNLDPPYVAQPDAGAGAYQLGSRDTPTMRRIKLEKALALRDKAQLLLAQDGGTLSTKNRRYIQAKSREILYGTRRVGYTGSLVRR